MRTSFVIRLAAFAVIATSLLSSGCAPRDPFHAASVSTQLARVDAMLKVIEKKPPAGFETLVPRHRESLSKASQTSSPVLRLYRLRDPWLGAETLTYLAAHPSAMKDLAAFETLWNIERAAIERAEPPRVGRLPRALGETAANRAQVLFRASLPYARTSSPGDGLYYLAEAVANRRFAEYLQSLDSGRGESVPSRNAVEAALDKIEGETLTAFDKDPTGRTTIPASALSKECRELLRRGWIDGATLLLIETRIALTKRSGGTGGLPDLPLQPARRSDSLAALVEAMGAESEPADRKIVRAQVAPLYSALFKSVPPAKPAAAPVKITLVRWPYT